MRGIRLEFVNAYNNYLFRVLKCVDIAKYTWHISFYEIYTEKEGLLQGDFFEKELLTGDEFLEKISTSYYYIIFATIEAFPDETKIVKVENYSDYYNSDCNLFFLCVDCNEAYVYCKDPEVLKKIAAECNNTDILYKGNITDENDDIRFQ
jgi:hypothetical protein